MIWYHEQHGAEAPFDDPDEIIKTRKGATPARNWQHSTARAFMSLMRDTAELRDAFALKDWPLQKRIEVVEEIIALIETFDQDPDTVSQQSFAYIRTFPQVDQQFDEMVTKDELEQMMDDFEEVVRQNRRLAESQAEREKFQCATGTHQ
ncbi:hypothetical protein [Pseudomonas amygdali]|uniref:Uncharacterized protein n=2 Tax=Pseudomonas amygdali pv. lachrymans TaxID=53707 RepID=A0ABR5KQF7_PSEAV|nr:hypothetical protein [Pseudomonas amygdali]AXH59599.1 hypothetical protein PLA107_030715 [Pseudomonas amygdali pv. lachrymans str. M301315]KPC17028.1 Uncharacterized protein AC499_0230 [Pseudomonas amygdali pv. lachrymans]KPC17987.1 Uncharacterized protein AC499_1189 [Pseudomonas amygdali pv. lachrymans]RMT05806.1 hypothetical protein ALP54_03522 [Pseudomonas amygdali pv. lachrymans]